MHEQRTIDWDICQNRHGNNPESVAAFGTGKQHQRNEVLKAITEAGSTGITCDELAAKWGVGQNALSGRFSELFHIDKVIEKAGTRTTRAGSPAAVYIVTENQP